MAEGDCTVTKTASMPLTSCPVTHLTHWSAVRPDYMMHLTEKMQLVRDGTPQSQEREVKMEGLKRQGAQ